MMMIAYRKVALATMLGLAPLPAQAASWWLLPDASTPASALFADSDSVMREKGGVSLRVLRIDRSGGGMESTHWTRCDGNLHAADEEALRRFACATPEERMGSALMLGAMPPEEAARLVFTVKEGKTGS